MRHAYGFNQTGFLENLESTNYIRNKRNGSCAWISWRDSLFFFSLFLFDVHATFLNVHGRRTRIKLIRLRINPRHECTLFYYNKNKRNRQISRYLLRLLVSALKKNFLIKNKVQYIIQHKHKDDSLQSSKFTIDNQYLSTVYSHFITVYVFKITQIRMPVLWRRKQASVAKK